MIGTVTPQVATIALAVGLLFALVCYLATNLSPGGMITPGWLALTLAEDPMRMATIAGLVALTYGGSLLLQRYVILYGKRLFSAVMMLSVALSVGLFLALQADTQVTYSPWNTVGFIIPGLIGYQLIRQPAMPTLLSTGIASLASYGVLASGVLLGFVTTI